MRPRVICARNKGIREHGVYLGATEQCLAVLCVWFSSPNADFDTVTPKHLR